MRMHLYNKLIMILTLFCISGLIPIHAETASKIVVLKNLKFPKIKDYNVELECVSPEREFKAGTVPKMTFRLRNYAMKHLIIYEWYSKESDNIRLYYVPWKPKMKVPPKAQWNAIIPEIPKNPKHISMELTHRSSVLVDIDLSFIKDIKTDHIQYFYIFTELNLTSIHARSEFIKITVKP